MPAAAVSVMPQAGASSTAGGMTRQRRRDGGVSPDEASLPRNEGADTIRILC